MDFKDSFFTEASKWAFNEIEPAYATEMLADFNGKKKTISPESTMAILGKADSLNFQGALEGFIGDKEFAISAYLQNGDDSEFFIYFNKLEILVAESMWNEKSVTTGGLVSIFLKGK